MSDLKVIETPGRQQLKAWLDAESGRNPSKLATMLGLSQPAVRNWVIGAARPEQPYREALHVLCGIPTEAWELDGERELRLRAIRLAASALADQEPRDEEPESTSSPKAGSRAAGAAG